MLDDRFLFIRFIPWLKGSVHTVAVSIDLRKLRREWRTLRQKPGVEKERKPIKRRDNDRADVNSGTWFAERRGQFSEEAQRGRQIQHRFCLMLVTYSGDSFKTVTHLDCPSFLWSWIKGKRRKFPVCKTTLNLLPERLLPSTSPVEKRKAYLLNNDNTPHPRGSYLDNWGASLPLARSLVYNSLIYLVDYTPLNFVFLF